MLRGRCRKKPLSLQLNQPVRSHSVQIGRSLEPIGRLARRHRHVGDLTDTGRFDAVQTGDGTGWNVQTAPGLTRPLHDSG